MILSNREFGSPFSFLLLLKIKSAWTFYHLFLASLNEEEYLIAATADDENPENIGVSLQAQSYLSYR